LGIELICSAPLWGWTNCTLRDQPRFRGVISGLLLFLSSLFFFCNILKYLLGLFFSLPMGFSICFEKNTSYLRLFFRSLLNLTFLKGFLFFNKLIQLIKYKHEILALCYYFFVYFSRSFYECRYSHWITWILNFSYFFENIDVTWIFFLCYEKKWPST